MEKIVIIPTYNERENITPIISAVFDLQEGYHVLVIDDGSPDGTADIVKTLITNEYTGKLFFRRKKR